MRESYYEDKFFCKNEDVDAVINSIYKNPRSSKNKVCKPATFIKVN